MRSTLTIDDAVFRELKGVAHRTDASLKEVVNRALRAGLASLRAPPPAARKAYRVRTYRMGNRPGIDFDKALGLASALEDEETVREIALRK